MTNGPAHLDLVHICQDCKKEVVCTDPAWLCPWNNDDEIQMCDPCLDKLAIEMERWEREQETNPTECISHTISISKHNKP